MRQAIDLSQHQNVIRKGINAEREPALANLGEGKKTTTN
jgi:hypothetical protein